MQAGLHHPVTGGSAARETRSLSIVIPAYNEERRLPATLQSVRRFIDDRGYDAELIVVDDGSRDRTSEVAGAAGPDVRVITQPTNRGKGYAVRTGVLASTREAVLFSDADQSTPIEDVERFWPAYDAGADVVIASRRLAASEIIGRQPWYRRTIGRAFQGLVSLAGLRGIHDTQCGFKLFRATAGRPLFTSLQTPGFAFDVEILLRASRLGMRVVEVPVRWEDSRESKVHPMRDSVRMLLEILRIRRSL